MISASGPIIINLDSISISTEEKDLLSSNLIGGVILFSHNYANKNQIKSLISSIKEIRDNIIICIDHEGGRIQRFKNEFTSLPSFQLIGNLYSIDKIKAEDLAYYSGYIAGYELKDIGVDINFSPVIDLTSKSAVLNSRTFSDNPNVVVDLACKYIQGYVDNGIIPTLKHFPGHGVITTDTHTDISYCDLPYEQLDSHICSFQNIHNKINIPIMTGHIIYPKVSEQPVTSSSKWLQEISNNLFSYKPFFISDDLEMKGLSDHFKDESRLNIFHKVISSGCDMTIITTMQNQKLIEDKKSYYFYQKEFIEPLCKSDKFQISDINIPCSDDISYNIGDFNVYKNALKYLDNMSLN